MPFPVIPVKDIADVTVMFHSSLSSVRRIHRATLMSGIRRHRSTGRVLVISDPVSLNRQSGLRRTSRGGI